MPIFNYFSLFLNEKMKNYYKILELEPTATPEQIKSQYHLLLHAWHPDKFPNIDQKVKADERIKEINEAYNVLGDPIKRENYDRYDRELRSYSPPPVRPVYSQTQNPSSEKSKQYCVSCGLPAETKYVEFYENVGLLFMRYHRTVKGNLCKSCIDYYFWNLTGKTMLLGWWGVISFFITPFILLNNFIRFLFTISMKKPNLKIAPNPSFFWVFSAVGGFLLFCFLIFFFVVSVLVLLTNNSSTSANGPIYSQTQSLSHPFYNDINCYPWTSIHQLDVGSRICIYGKVYSYGPYSNQWSIIQFSSTSTAIRMKEFNYFYSDPLKVGDCVIVCGTIRKDGENLIIVPDKNVSEPILVGPSEYCDK